MNVITKIGCIFYAVATIAIAVQQIFYGDFCPIFFPRWPNPIPGYNVLAYAGGNPLRYLSNVAARKEEFESTGGTTLGYHFYYMASYLLFFVYLRKAKKRA